MATLILAGLMAFVGALGDTIHRIPKKVSEPIIVKLDK